jgi:hypothetical protein
MFDLSMQCGADREAIFVLTLQPNFWVCSGYILVIPIIHESPVESMLLLRLAGASHHSRYLAPLFFASLGHAALHNVQKLGFGNAGETVLRRSCYKHFAGRGRNTEMIRDSRPPAHVIQLLALGPIISWLGTNL